MNLYRSYIRKSSNCIALCDEIIHERDSLLRSPRRVLRFLPYLLQRFLHPLRQLPAIVPAATAGALPQVQTLPQHVPAQVHRHFGARPAPPGPGAELRPALHAREEQAAPSALGRGGRRLERAEPSLAVRLLLVLAVVLGGPRLVLPGVRHGVGGDEADVPRLVPHVLDPRSHGAGRLPHPLDVHGVVVILWGLRPQPALLLPLQLSLEVVKPVLEVVVRPAGYDLGHLGPLGAYRGVEPPYGRVLQGAELGVLEPGVEVVDVSLAALLARPLGGLSVEDRRGVVAQGLGDDGPLERMLHLEDEIQKVLILRLGPRLGQRLPRPVPGAAALARFGRRRRRARRRLGQVRLALVGWRRRRIRVHRRRRPRVVARVRVLIRRRPRPRPGRRRSTVPRAWTGRAEIASFLS
mmetsp:Transcript_46621/g.98939  ORF Transcript_46621/g.98939 Transcript_46621/m.98939 type:complete len:408 (+) Transcript_46621:42-1265(+)